MPVIHLLWVYLICVSLFEDHSAQCASLSWCIWTLLNNRLWAHKPSWASPFVINLPQSIWYVIYTNYRCCFIYHFIHSFRGLVRETQGSSASAVECFSGSLFMLSLRRRQMTVMASRITGQSSFCSTVCSDSHQRNIKSPRYCPFARGIPGHRGIPPTRDCNAENASIW